MAKHKVILWGPGILGEYVLRYLKGHPDLELVGVRCYSPEKEGKDPAEAIGLPSSGVTATSDVDALLALDADCVIFGARSNLMDHTAPGSPDQPLEEELVRILASGKNVVTPIGSFLHWRNLVNGKESFERINAACQQGNSTVYATGLDPGYTDCVLGATVASLVGEITQIRSYEVLDYSSYRRPETLAVMGFGGKPEEVPDMGHAIIGYWGGSVYTLAESCGVVLDDVVFGGDIWVSPETYTAKNGLTVQAGTVGAIRFSVSGILDGETRLQLNHVNRMGANAAPAWPVVGELGGYRIEVDGFPPLRADFPFALPGGTGDAIEDGVCMAAARLLNSIDAVVAAPPGHVTTNDLPLIGPRFGMAVKAQ